MAGLIDTSEIDFDNYKISLKTYLKGQDRYKDVNFDGSNFSVLIDILARNTYQMGFYYGMIAAERFLDSALLRESVVSKAKELNYIPRSRTSAKTLVDITITAPDNPSSIVIPKFYTFQTNSIIFSTTSETVVYNVNNQFVANGVQIAEGRVVRETFVANTNSRYIISSSNVDISSIEVEIQNSIYDEHLSTWNYTESLFGLNPTSNVYFVQGYSADKYEIVFGNDITGRSLTLGNVVRVTYRDTLGEEGNGYSRFTAIKNIEGYSSINVVLTDSPSFGGGEKETIESIKFNAPRHYSVQGRAIATTDYTTLIMEKFPGIEKVVVFGGEELEQKRYGQVIISAKPYGSDYLTNAVKNDIISFLAPKTATGIDPVYIDPDFFYINVTTSVNYDPDITNKSAGDLSALVMANIMKYRDEKLANFSSSFRYSKLTGYIDNADEAIQSNETDTRVIKRIAPTIGIGQSYTINYNTQLDYFVSSPFLYTQDGVDYTATIENWDTNLRLTTVNALNQKVVLNQNIGTYDYLTGKIVINSMIYSGYTNFISLYGKTSDLDFLTSRNQMINIDPRDVYITMNVV